MDDDSDDDVLSFSKGIIRELIKFFQQFFKQHWYKELLKAYIFTTLVAFKGERKEVTENYEKVIYHGLVYYMFCA